jgi:hypothetical protein
VSGTPATKVAVGKKRCAGREELARDMLDGHVRTTGSFVDTNQVKTFNSDFAVFGA